MNRLQPYSAVLLDIEGTTTSIAFVYDTLFPYARAHARAFLNEHWDALTLERALFETEGTRTDTAEGLAAVVLAEMDADQKSTALKALQGRIWEAGYADGTLRAHVFDDVPEALRRWNEAGKAVSIYSSGSVAAQRLLFGHTLFGDLMPSLSGFFDTTSGAKQDAASYGRIAAAMGWEPSAVLFATDVVAEADAAVVAGMQAVVMDRPGNRPQPAHGHPVAADFTQI